MKPKYLPPNPYEDLKWYEWIDWYEVFLIGSAVICFLMIVFAIIATILLCLSIF